MPHERGGAWAKKTVRERWSIRRCGSIRPSRGPSICGPRAQCRADFHRLASINIATRERGIIFPVRVPEPEWPRRFVGGRDSAARRRPTSSADSGRNSAWRCRWTMCRSTRRRPAPIASCYGTTTRLRSSSKAESRRRSAGSSPSPRRNGPSRLTWEPCGSSTTARTWWPRALSRRTPGSARAMSSGSGTRRTAGRSRSDAQSWTDPRWPGRKRARRSRRSITSATRSGGSAKRSPDVPRLRAVLFDIDGTLLDTRDAWVAAFDAGLAAIRKTSISGSEAAQWIGTPIEVIYAERCGLPGDELAKAVREFQRIEAESVREGMRAYPGVREAIASLTAWKLAAVTNKRRDTSIEALRVTGLLPFFALVLGGDSVPHKKPTPDPVLRAASALGVAPTECAVVGDTENDVVAGKAAGARTVRGAAGDRNRARLEAAGGDYLIETPDALAPRFPAPTPKTAARGTFTPA